MVYQLYRITLQQSATNVRHSDGMHLFILIEPHCYEILINCTQTYSGLLVIPVECLGIGQLNLDYQ